MDRKTDMQAADSRALKSAREVLRRGKFVKHPVGEDGLVRVAIVERTGTATVTADPAWVKPPACTCNDYWGNVRFGTENWCRHVVAVLAKEEELRCQLIDLLL